MQIKNAICTAAATVLLANAPGARATTTIQEYLFSGNLNDTAGAGLDPVLTANGGALGNSGYTFGNGQGLSLSNWVTGNAQEDYTIEMYVRFSSFGNGSYGKLVDFKDRSSDNGFYIRDNGGARPVFYNENHGDTNGQTMSLGQFHHIVISRGEAGTDNVGIWLDGVLQRSFTDTTSQNAVFSGPNNIIHFFKDDSGGENPAGVVDYIRIYDNDNVDLSQAEVTQWYNARPIYGTAEVVVNKRTGEITIASDNPFEPVTMRGYQLTSDAGTFDTDTWESFDETDADGGTWSQANPSATQLAELNLTGSASLGTTDSRSLGHAYAGGLDGAQDLDFAYLAPGLSEGQSLSVRYITDEGQAGDLNGDGFVGAEDLDIVLSRWGDSVARGALIYGDAVADGTIDDADLQVVRDHWGEGTLPSGNVPEPGTLLALLGLAGTLCTRRRR